MKLFSPRTPGSTPWSQAMGGPFVAPFVDPVVPLAGSQVLLTAPFDAMRNHYAAAVVAGIVPRSKLASGHFERYLHALEFLMLGPLARRR